MNNASSEGLVHQGVKTAHVRLSLYEAHSFKISSIYILWQIWSFLSKSVNQNKINGAICPEYIYSSGFLSFLDV